MRCMIYGSPSTADAELRMRQAEQMADLLMRTPPQAFTPGPLTGPPRY